jgi:hypothetical protein
MGLKWTAYVVRFPIKAPIADIDEYVGIKVTIES